MRALVGLDGEVGGLFASLALGYLMICAMQFFIFEITAGIVSSVLSQFFCAVFLAYFSGCLYPINYFPDALRKISEFLPTGALRSLLSGCALGDVKPINVAFICVYTALFLSLAIFARKRRICAEGGDGI